MLLALVRCKAKIVGFAVDFLVALDLRKNPFLPFARATDGSHTVKTMAKSANARGVKAFIVGMLS